MQMRNDQQFGARAQYYWEHFVGNATRYNNNNNNSSSSNNNNSNTTNQEINCGDATIKTCKRKKNTINATTSIQNENKKNKKSTTLYKNLVQNHTKKNSQNHHRCLNAAVKYNNFDDNSSRINTSRNQSSRCRRRRRRSRNSSCCECDNDSNNQDHHDVDVDVDDDDDDSKTCLITNKLIYSLLNPTTITTNNSVKTTNIITTATATTTSISNDKLKQRCQRRCRQQEQQLQQQQQQETEVRQVTRQRQRQRCPAFGSRLLLSLQKQFTQLCLVILLVLPSFLVTSSTTTTTTLTTTATATTSNILIQHTNGRSVLSSPSMPLKLNLSIIDTNNNNNSSNTTNTTTTSNNSNISLLGIPKLESQQQQNSYAYLVNNNMNISNTIITTPHTLNNNNSNNSNSKDIKQLSKVDRTREQQQREQREREQEVVKTNKEIPQYNNNNNNIYNNPRSNAYSLIILSHSAHNNISLLNKTKVNAFTLNLHNILPTINNNNNNNSSNNNNNNINITNDNQNHNNNNNKNNNYNVNQHQQHQQQHQLIEGSNRIKREIHMEKFNSKKSEITEHPDSREWMSFDNINSNNYKSKPNHHHHHRRRHHSSYQQQQQQQQKKKKQQQHQNEHQYEHPRYKKSIDKDRLTKLVMNGLGLKKLPDMSKANISQIEYTSKYTEYLKRVQRQLLHVEDMQMDMEPTGGANNENSLHLLSIATNRFSDISEKRWRRKRAMNSRDFQRTTTSAAAAARTTRRFAKKPIGNVNKTNILLHFPLNVDETHINAHSVDEANIRLMLLYSSALAAKRGNNGAGGGGGGGTTTTNTGKQRTKSKSKGGGCGVNSENTEAASMSTTTNHERHGNHHGNGGNRGSRRNHKLNLKIFQLLASNRRELLDTRKLEFEHHNDNNDETRSQWLEFDVTKAVRAWLSKTHENLGIEIQCDKCRNIGARILSDVNESSGDSNTNGGDIDADDERFHLTPVLNIIGHLGHTHREGGRHHPKSNSTSNYIHHNANNGDTHKYMMPNNCYKAHQRCCRHKLDVVFKEIKGFEFIIQPKMFDAGYCQGGCPPRHNPAHHHALLQSLIWQQDHNRAPRPCCAPSKLAEVEVLHVDEEHSDKLKISTWSDMQVIECACS